MIFIKKLTARPLGGEPSAPEVFAFGKGHRPVNQRFITS